MKEHRVDNFSVLIGIDWADKKHDICEHIIGTEDFSCSVISSKPEAVHQWATSLKKRFPNQPIAVASELKKGPLISVLSQYKHITLFTINPASVSKYRTAFTHSGAKDDPSDALLQTEILKLHMDKLTPISKETSEVRILGELVEYCRRLVQDKVKLTNRITSYLKNYYPQALEWFEEKDTVVFCDFLSKWPSLTEAKKARKQTLNHFFHQHNSRYPEVIKRRVEQIKSAQALTLDDAVIVPNRIMVNILVPQLKLLLAAIKDLDSDIKCRYRQQSDSKIFDSLPGAGPKLAPRLLVAFGTDRARYNSANEIQKSVGVAPVIERSGKKSWTHWRYACPKFLRQTFVEWAGQSVKYSFWAKAYYEQQKSIGKPHNTIIRSLAFKWIRIAYRCWKTKTLYNESRYLEALKLKGSPLLKFAIEG